LAEVRADLDRGLDELARSCAGRSYAEVLAALERKVAAAGVLPSRPDLSQLAREISDAPRSR
jgi:hypothetical protein